MRRISRPSAPEYSDGVNGSTYGSDRHRPRRLLEHPHHLVVQGDRARDLVDPRRRSQTYTDKPACPSGAAATTPEGPKPMIATSKTPPSPPETAVFCYRKTKSQRTQRNHLLTPSFPPHRAPAHSSGLGDDRVAQRADALDLDLEEVAGLHPHRRRARLADAGRRAHHDARRRVPASCSRTAARWSRRRRRSCRGVRVLHHLAVQAALDAQARWHPAAVRRRSPAPGRSRRWRRSSCRWSTAACASGSRAPTCR